MTGVGRRDGGSWLVGGSSNVGVSIGGADGVAWGSSGAVIEPSRNGGLAAFGLAIDEGPPGTFTIGQLASARALDQDIVDGGTSATFVTSVARDIDGGLVLAGTIAGHHVFGARQLVAFPVNGNGVGGAGFIWRVRRDGVDDVGGCRSSAECPGQICEPLSRTCVDACTAAADCGAGNSCDLLTGLCGSDCSSIPCGAGFACRVARAVSSTCVPVCTAFAPGALCSAETECCSGASGLCVEASADRVDFHAHVMTPDVGGVQWQEVLDTSPFRRAGAPIGVVGGVPVLFSGTGSTGPDAFAFQEGSNAWIVQTINDGSPVPAACDLTDGVGFATANNALWMLGGRTRDGAANGTVCELSPAGTDFVDVSERALALPLVVIDAAVAAVGTSLLVFGGTDDAGIATGALRRLDVAAQTLAFETLVVSGGPGPRHGATMTVDPADAGALLLLGGIVDGQASAEVWRLTDAAGTPGWQRLADLPTPRAFAGAVTFANQFAVIVGGSDGSDATRDVLRFEGGVATLLADVGFDAPRRGLRPSVVPLTTATTALVVGGVDIVTEGVCLVDGVGDLPLCGDGRLDVGEVCEDGNIVGGDGCAADCRSFDGLTSEVEPNDDGATAVGTDDFQATAAQGPFPGDAIIAGSIADGDEDAYAITNPGVAPVTVTLRTFGVGGLGTCTFDSIIQVRGADGIEVANDDDGGDGACSLLDVRLQPAETLFVNVTAFSDDGAFDYRLQLNFAE
jgi:cysteine-rich repeat protein